VGAPSVVSSLPATIARFIDAMKLDDAQDRRVRIGLERALEPVARSSWPDVAWRFSRLTGDGTPIEFAFTDTGEIRATIEVAGPETPDTVRLAMALSALPATKWPSVLVGLHDTANSLRWGAWRSVRWKPNDSERYGKVYAEWPADRETPPAWHRFVGDGQLRFIGWEPVHGRTELYVRSPGRVDLDELGLRAARCGIVGFVASVSDVIERISGRRPDRVFESGQTGWSITLRPDGEPVAIGALIAARAACGGERRIRPALLAAADHYGWNIDGYRNATSALAAGAYRAQVHGFVAIAADRRGRRGFQIGIRPFDNGDIPCPS
jgi:hypothetical protein